ncbi:plasmid mobilization relaxosome protein MobC [Plastorhodobacter daqingensis]|uniref:Plasmid mobilization relaxosome protein MobC n=1 Tax=Plastorhodobacter daqingensis TaxID=1387281 RepID=A0ABW2UMF7_9RHOB
MSRGRRLTETERLNIAQERLQGVAAGDLATRYGVSLKSVYNAANHAADRQTANGSRPKVIGVRVSPKELQRFDDALASHGVVHRSDALRCLILAADDLLRPDEGMTDELRGLSAALNRVGNNVNQVARRLNEAKLKGERLPYTPASHAEIRDLAVLVFDMADQIQEMFRGRRRVLDLEVTKALAGLARQGAEHGAE